MCVLKRVHVIASVGKIPRDGTRSVTGRDGFFKGTSYFYIAGWSGTGRDGMGQVFFKGPRDCTISAYDLSPRTMS